MEYFGITALVVVYFLPSFIAGFAKHHNGGAIFILNLFAGWSVIGWIAALVWSCTSPPPARGVSPEAKKAPATISYSNDELAELNVLHRLRKDGTLSEDQFAAAIGKLGSVGRTV